jgi:flagellar biosynthesis protein FliQ
MTFGDAISIGREALFVAMLAAAPVLLVSMVVGLVVSLFQAVTQIQEPTLAFIPKIAVAGMALMFFGPFILAMLTDFLSRTFAHVANFVH